MNWFQVSGNGEMSSHCHGVMSMASQDSLTSPHYPGRVGLSSIASPLPETESCIVLYELS